MGESLDDFHNTAAAPTTETNSTKDEEGIMTEESIAGQIKLNNEIFQVSCDCSDEWKAKIVEEAIGTSNVTNSTCRTPSRFEIQRVDNENIEGAIKETEVRDFMGRPSSLSYVETGSKPLSDTDGRYAKEGLFSPGGEAAQFILACTAYEQMTNKTLDSNQVGQLFGDYLSSINSRKFTFHSSETAVEQLQEEIRSPGLDLASPASRKEQQFLLGEKCRSPAKPPCGLMDPLNVGVSQLRLMMSKPGQFLVREELVGHVVKAIYSTLWSSGKPGHDQIEFSVYPRDTRHNEGAIALVDVSETCESAGRAPLMSQQTKKTNGKEYSMYIVHMSAVRHRRKELAKFFVGKSRGNSDVILNEVDFVHRLEVLGMRSLNNAAESLAGTVPMYRVRIV
eukprot:g4306.t1